MIGEEGPPREGRKVSTIEDTQQSFRDHFREADFEHITLETREHPGPRPHELAEFPGTPVRTFEHVGRNGQMTSMAILRDGRLRIHRPGTSLGPVEYHVDLRFIDPSPVLSHSLPWVWLGFALVLGTLATVLIHAVWSGSTSATGPLGITGAVGALLALGMVCAAIRHCESRFALRSMNGRALLACLVCRLGARPGGEQFFKALADSIEATRKGFTQTRSEFLRDEMREHHRLFELGVVPPDQYEAARARILAAH